ncbi:hypothetical protein GCM10009693_15530 [Leucobacter chromiireducens subsp. chromiireducens]
MQSIVTYMMPDLLKASDQRLLRVSRSGSKDAFEVLWQRHAAAQLAVIRGIPTLIDTGEILGIARRRSLALIAGGADPQASVRAFFALTAQSVARDQARIPGPPQAVQGDVQKPEPPAPQRSSLVGAYFSLSRQRRELLWYHDVELLGATECARYTGTPASLVSNRVKSDRKSLWQAWIKEELGSGRNLSTGCREFLKQSRRYSENRLGLRHYETALRHVGGCTRCLVLAGHAERVHERLATLLPHAVFGENAKAYRDWIDQGTPAPRHLDLDQHSTKARLDSSTFRERI